MLPFVAVSPLKTKWLLKTTTRMNMLPNQSQCPSCLIGRLHCPASHPLRLLQHECPGHQNATFSRSAGRVAGVRLAPLAAASACSCGDLRMQRMQHSATCISI